MLSRSSKFALVCALLISVPLFAAKFWEKKEFTSWTEQECTELLKKSPWAYSGCTEESNGKPGRSYSKKNTD